MDHARSVKGQNNSAEGLWKALLTVGILTVCTGPAFARGPLIDLGRHPVRSQLADAPNTYELCWDEVSLRRMEPAEISAAVRQRVHYVADRYPEDQWRSGRETWDGRKGDCEDFAAAVRDLNHANGYPARLYVLQSKSQNSAHAVTVGTYEGVTWVSSNGVYRELKSMREVKEDVARELGWWAPEVTIHAVVPETLVSHGERESRASDRWR